VLDHIAQDGGVEGAGGQVGVEQTFPAHVETQALARIGRGERAGLHAHALPPTLARFCEQEADPAAEVEQARRAGRGGRVSRGGRPGAGRPRPRHPSLDAGQSAARGLALAGLLAE